MKTILLLILLFTLSNSYSQDSEWTQLFENKQGNFFFKPNSNNTAWIKIVSEKTKYTLENSTQEKIVDGYRVMLYKFDCYSKKIGVMKLITYSKDGELLDSINLKEYQVEMDYPNPDSVGEGFLKLFCVGK